MQRETGFGRSVDDTARWAARPVDYLVSSAHAHAGLLAYARTIGPYLEVLFPGFVAVALGAAGIVLLLRRRSSSSVDLDDPRAGAEGVVPRQRVELHRLARLDGCKRTALGPGAAPVRRVAPGPDEALGAVTGR